MAWAGALLALLCTMPQGVQAQARQSSEAKRAASEHFRRGVELYQEGAYRPALIELKRAHEIAPDYRVLYNIGQAHYALAEYVDAIRAFESYLAQGGSELAAARQEEVSHTLAGLKQRVASLRITTDYEDAVIRVDGVKAGMSPVTMTVNVGRHEVYAETADGANGSQTIDIAGGDKRTIALRLSAPALAAAEPELPPPPPPPPPAGMSKRGRWGVALLSSGAAVAAAGAVMAVLAKQADSDYDAALRARPGSPTAIRSAHEDLQRNAWVADALFGTAAVLGVTGLVLLWVREPEHASVQVGFGPQSVFATGRF